MLLVKIHSLLVTRCKISRYSLQNSLVTHCKSCWLQKSTRYSLPKLLVAEIHSLLVAKFTHYSLQKVTRYSFQKLLVVKSHSLLLPKFDFYLLHEVIKYSHFQSNLIKDDKIKWILIYWMLYINKNHVEKFSLVCLEIAHGSSHPRISSK